MARSVFFPIKKHMELFWIHHIHQIWFPAIFISYRKIIFVEIHFEILKKSWIDVCSQILPKVVDLCVLLEVLTDGIMCEAVLLRFHAAGFSFYYFGASSKVSQSRWQLWCLERCCLSTARGMSNCQTMS